MADKEKIVEHLCKMIQYNIPLTEFGRTKSNALDIIDRHSNIVIRHLICCMLAPNNKDYNHWKGEVYGNFDRNYRLKNNKYLNYNQLKTLLKTWKEDMEDSIIADINYVTDKENIKVDIQDINIPLLIDCIYRYLDWVCNQICFDVKLDNYEAYEKIDMLVKEYNK